MSNKKDLIGQRFGKLMVKYAVDSIGVGRKKRAMWFCECDCGNAKVISAKAILEGQISCGCVNFEPLTNYINKIFGSFEVIGEKPQQGGKKSFIMKCVKCGFEKLLRPFYLKRGDACECHKCATKENHHSKRDFTGFSTETFEVLGKKRDSQRGGRDKSIWNCQCQCGKSFPLSSVFLNSTKAKNSTKKCRICTRMESMPDLSKVKFGKISPIRYLPDFKKWECKCDCGKIFNTTTASLMEGASKSCGCVIIKRNSENRELRIFNILESAYRSSAKARGINYKLSGEDFRKLSLQDCHYCGEKPSRPVKDNGSSKVLITNTVLYVNGIDRVDSSKDYDASNCVPCCSMCNRMKMDNIYDKFLKQIEKIYFFRVKKNVDFQKDPDTTHDE